MSWRQVILLFSDETGRHFTACSCMFLMTGSSSSKLASGGRRKLQGRSRRRIGGKTRTVIVMDLGWLAFAWLFRSGGLAAPCTETPPGLFNNRSQVSNGESLYHGRCLRQPISYFRVGDMLSNTGNFPCKLSAFLLLGRW